MASFRSFQALFIDLWKNYGRFSKNHAFSRENHQNLCFSLNVLPITFEPLMVFQWNFQRMLRTYSGISTKIVQRSYVNLVKPWHRVYMEFYCFIWLLGPSRPQNRFLPSPKPWATFFISIIGLLSFFVR